MTKQDYIDQTVNNMKSLGVYREQFDPLISIYADLLYQYEETYQRYVNGGMKNQTKTSGGMKTSPIVGILKDLKKEIISFSDRLGLNPKALESIKNAHEEKATGLEIALKGFDDLVEKYTNSRND